MRRARVTIRYVLDVKATTLRLLIPLHRRVVLSRRLVRYYTSSDQLPSSSFVQYLMSTSLKLSIRPPSSITIILYSPPLSLQAIV
jgi:hypothetical protein